MSRDPKPRNPGSGEVTNLRIPPWSNQAEQALLGALMLDNETWDVIADQVREEDFYRHNHRLIFRGIRQLADKRSPFDVVTLSEVLGRHGWLEDAGGLEYLATMAKDTPSASNIVAYAHIVREKSIQRQLIHAGTTISDLAFNPENQNLGELLQQADQAVFSITQQYERGASGPVAPGPILQRIVEKVSVLYEQNVEVIGLPTGFRELDQLTGGWKPGQFILVGGRPSMGKSSLAMQFAEHAALVQGVPVLVFSLEMEADELLMRSVSSLASIPGSRLSRGRLHDEEFAFMNAAITRLSEAPLRIDATPALTAWEIRARARRQARAMGPLGLILIDYIQIMGTGQSGSRSEETRNEAVAEIARSLKALAKELGVPVIALSQLNRKLEERPDKRPRLSDLRDSGALEQDSDVVIFVYRDEKYKKDSPDKGIAEIIVEKQRNGETGTVRLKFEGEYTRFRDIVDYGAMGGY